MILMTVNYQFPQHLNRVRAWDKLSKVSVEVYADDWKVPFSTVLVWHGAESWHVRRDDLDFRYYGEPSDADEATRRQWQRRAARDRRELWYRVHRRTDSQLLRDVDRASEVLEPWWLRVARAEVARRVARRTVNDPSEAVRASDRRALQRQHAAQHSRERVQEWDRKDRERDNARRGL